MDDSKKVNYSQSDELPDLQAKLKQAKNRGVDLESQLIIAKGELGSEKEKRNQLLSQIHLAQQLLSMIFEIIDNDKVYSSLRQQIETLRVNFESSIKDKVEISKNEAITNCNTEPDE